MDKTIIIDTPDKIQAFHYLQMYHALKLEVKCPGLRFSRGSIMELVRQEFGIKPRTKVKVLAELTQILTEKGILS